MRTLFVLAMCAVALIAQAPAGKQAKGKAAEQEAPLAEWRRSAPVFAREFREFTLAHKEQVPLAPLAFMAQGGPVPDTFQVTRVYSGVVEWEALFMGVNTDGTEISGRPRKVKFDGLGFPANIYPATDATNQWAKLGTGVRLRFRGVLEGVAWFSGVADGIPFASIKDAVPLP